MSLVMVGDFRHPVTTLKLRPRQQQNNVKATLSNATSRTILSTKTNVASTLLLAWNGLYMTLTAVLDMPRRAPSLQV